MFKCAGWLTDVFLNEYICFMTIRQNLNKNLSNEGSEKIPMFVARVLCQPWQCAEMPGEHPGCSGVCLGLGRDLGAFPCGGGISEQLWSSPAPGKAFPASSVPHGFRESVVRTTLLGCAASSTGETFGIYQRRFLPAGPRKRGWA